MRQMKHNNYQQNAHQQDYGLVKFYRLSRSSENNCKQEKKWFPTFITRVQYSTRKSSTYISIIQQRKFGVTSE